MGILGSIFNPTLSISLNMCSNNLRGHLSRTSVCPISDNCHLWYATIFSRPVKSTYLVFWLAYLVFGGLFGVHYIFVGVIGVCGIGMLYLLHLEFGMMHLIFSSQKMCRFLFSFSE